MDQELHNAAIPSLFNVRCQHCGSSDFNLVGQYNAYENNMSMGLIYGINGVLVNAKNVANQAEAAPLEYVCNDCKKYFLTGPLIAGPEEILQTPAVVNVERLRNMYGAAVSFFVYINGYKVGEVKNGGTITFQTPLRFNTLAITNSIGVAFKAGTTRFRAKSGETINLRFNKKFL